MDSEFDAFACNRKMNQHLSKVALFVSPDLLFAGKIQSSARAHGMIVRNESNLAAVGKILTEQSVSIIFVDLNLQSPSVSEVMGLVPANPRPVVVAFGPHVNTASLEEAKQLGCDYVLPRSRFIQELPHLLQFVADGD